MTPFVFRCARRAALACLAATALVPAAAQASTWTVDDDRVQCPNAGFTSVQAAVNQAAPWDTVLICDGTYYESSTPASGTSSPSQTGSRNGVTITKPITIKGTGASKVSIRPAPALAPSLAGTAPYLRDGGGNVITVTRQSAGATADNENWVDISGVTVESPDIYAEAGIAFFNTSGTIANSVVGPLKRAADGAELTARPHGWGVVMTNHMQGAEAGVQRQLNISGTLVTGYQSGGVLFDDSRGTDGNATTLQRSGIKAYGRITASRIQGSGPDALIPQTGVQWHAGQRGSITRSVVTGNLYTPDLRRSVGVLLTDAETGNDPSNPTVRAWWALENQITQNGWGMFNANINNTAVRLGAPAYATSEALGLENWWGCSGGPVVGAQSAGTALTSCQGISGPDSGSAQSIERGVTRPNAPFLPAVPAPTPDALPTATFADPVADGDVIAGEPVDPVVVATDDFGVKSVSVSVDGESLDTLSTYPYEYEWAPTFAQIGSTVTFEAVVTDSSGQTSTETIEVEVVAPDGYLPITVTPTSSDFGSVLVGNSVATELTVENSGENPLDFDGIDVEGAGYSLDEGTCVVDAVLQPDETCTVPVTFAPDAAGAADGEVSIAYTTPGGGPDETVSLTGTGTVPAVVVEQPEVLPEVKPPPPPPPPIKKVVVETVATPVKVTKSRKVTVGVLVCGTAKTCTTKVTATVKIGGKTYRFTNVVTTGRGTKALLTVRISKTALAALEKTKSKRAQLKVTSRAKDTGGGASSRTKTLSIRA